MHASLSRSRKLFAPALALSLAAALIPGVPASAAAAAVRTPPAPATADRVIVKFKPGADTTERAAAVRRISGVRRAAVAKMRLELIGLPTGETVHQAVETLERDPRVEYAEPDYRMSASLVPNDTYYSRQWGLPAVSAPSGWDISTGATSTIVAVIDTGVNAHSELTGRVTAGYDFVNRDSNAADDQGHGTAVAGVVGAAGNNAAGVAGVNWKTKIMPVKVLGATGSGYTSDIANGVIWAADRGAKVINLSLGGPTYSTTFKNAIDYATSKGAVVVAAAGNESSSANSYPAAYPNVVSVSALNGTAKATFSNYGPTIDIAAPGQSIYTTTRTGGYTYMSGTSFSSPMVAGLASLILARNPALTPAKVSQIITSTADDLGTAGRDNSFGWGRMNIARALKAAAPAPAPAPDTTKPTVTLTAPLDGTTIRGTVPVRATAADNIGVARIVFSLDGAALGTDTAAPYELSWNTAATYNGWHYVQATAYDAAGNAGTSTLAWVYTSNTW